MEHIEGEGICLRAVDFGENDKILTLYLAQKGKVAVKARGCKSQKSKLKYAATPLCFGKYYLAGRGRYTLAGCDLIDSFFFRHCRSREILLRLRNIGSSGQNVLGRGV